MSITQLIPSNDEDWQRQLRDVVSSGEELLSLLHLQPAQVDYVDLACRDFPLKVPHSFVRRMHPGDPDDPLLRQVLATGAEVLATPGYSEDPVGETGNANPQPGLIHKYHGRVLLIVSGGCAINCRYCFRRHFPYGENQNSRAQWRETLQAVADDQSISEVILSGGDPLIATDSYLMGLVAQIATIPHVKRLRVHTRLPVVIPARVTEDLLQALCHSRLETVVVIHSNHGNEIDSEVARAFQLMRDRGIHLLNQAVLLRGINDQLETQVDLCEKLFAAGVLPYYLHLLDKVQGAAHFDVPESAGIALISGLSARLPGYLVPRLVREVEGQPAKVNIPG